MLFHTTKIFVLILTFAVSLALISISEVKAILDVGASAPNFTLIDAISGNQISLSDYGGKIVVIDFLRRGVDRVGVS